MGKFRILTGIGLATAAGLLQWSIYPLVGGQAPFLFFIPSVLMAAIYLGPLPALIVLLAGAFNADLMMEPVGHLAIARPEGRFALLAYLLVGAMSLWYASRVRLNSTRAALAEARLRLAQEDTGIGVFELDFQAGTAFVSPSLCQLLVQPVMTGPIPLDDWLRRLDPQHVEESRATLEEKVARGELRYEREQRVQTSDGRVRWLLSRVRLDLTPDGKLAQARGATIDITQRKELDQQLQRVQSELQQQLADLQRLHSLSQQLVAAGDDLTAPLQSLLQIVMEFHGATHGLLSLSGPGAEGWVVAQRGLDQAVLQPAAFPAPEDIKDESALFARAHSDLAARLGFEAVHTTLMRSAAGEIMGAVSVFFPQSHVPAERSVRLSDLCVATAAAVVERERERAVAARNEQRFAVTLESSAVPFNILAPIRDEAARIVDLRWTYVNPAAARTIGRSVDQLIGKAVREIMPLNWESPELLAHYIAVIDHAEPREFEVQSPSRAGVWFHVIASPLNGAAAVWFADISELKRQERALQDADRRKDEFLATLAHELRNPLAPIRQAARIARMPGATDAQKRWSHELIERQVQNMALLLDDLLDVSRITRGTLLLRRSRVMLSSVIEGAVETARPLIEAKAHNLAIELPGQPLELEVDPLRMSQVVGNLLTNAAKYTDHGGRIVVAASLQGDELLIRVTDTGVGLDARDLGRLFEMFSQLPTGAGRAQGGLGIGLSLSRRLARLHGGDIEVSSAGAGRGSVFTVRLPDSCLLFPESEPRSTSIRPIALRSVDG